MHRRDLLNTAVFAGAASVMVTDRSSGHDSVDGSLKIIDTNVSLFQWPFRRLPLDDTNRLVMKMRELGINQAWAGSFEGVLHRDITAVNQRLSDACSGHNELIPIGSINLELPGWESDVRRCFDLHEMQGIRLHPNYHGYTLADPRFTKLLKIVGSVGKFIQIAVAIEDSRTQHPMMQVADVNLKQLPSLLRDASGAKVQILNARLPLSAMLKLAATDGLYFDVSRVDGTDGIANLVRGGVSDRILFGTHAPFLVPEAALIRIAESNLPDNKLAAVMHRSASKLRT